ncbi:hypothetical protein BJX64DRAFT_289104 [Aspergillus heterothallicus]
MSGIGKQKATGEQRYQSAEAEAGAIPAEVEGDPSFIKRKPGGSDTLPGWNQAKRAFGGIEKVGRRFAKIHFLQASDLGQLGSL